MSEPRFQPEEIFAALERHEVRYVLIGGLAATLHGSPVLTTDADICPARDRDNLDRLSLALKDLGARIRTSGIPGGLPFTCERAFLQQVELLNLMTRSGDLDISFSPLGTAGFTDLRDRAIAMTIRGHEVAVASLEDVIRSKEAAGRPKDQMALPALRLLLAQIRKRNESG